MKNNSKTQKILLGIGCIAVLGIGGYIIGQKVPSVPNAEIVPVEETMSNDGKISLSSAKGFNDKPKTMKVSLISDDENLTDDNEENNQTAIDLEAMRDEQIQSLLEENGLTMYDYVNAKEKITDAVLLQIEKILKEYDEKIAKVEANQGKNGVDGKDGKDGAMGPAGIAGPAGPTGKTGATGATGKTGATGATGKTGATGSPGKDGKDGEDGKSIFIRYSEQANGANMTLSPTANTKYIGTYEGTVASTDPTQYKWSKYVGKDGEDGKSSFIRYSESSTGSNMTTEPNSRTRYFGTYIGTQASNNPADYTWTQYKDMFSYYTETDNTLHFVIP